MGVKLRPSSQQSYWSEYNINRKSACYQGMPDLLLWRHAGISPKAKLKAPKSKIRQYRRLMEKAGFPRTKE